ncbi:MAG: hypothetical protein Kow0080_18870 [Candidatus Promineifilaceae bacterium]
MANDESGKLDVGMLPEGAVEELAELLDEQPNPDQEVRTVVLSRMLELLEQHFTDESELKLKGEAQKLQSEILELQAIEVELTQDELKALLNRLQSLDKQSPSVDSPGPDEPIRTVKKPKELEKMNDKTLEGMPDGFTLPRRSPLRDSDESWQEKTVMSTFAKALIDNGEALIEKFHAHLRSILKVGEGSGVKEHFNEYVSPPQDIATLKEELEQEGFMEQVSEDDLARDEALATALNAFESGNVDHLSQMQKAKANWVLAVRKYKAESRQAWRTLKITLQKPTLEKTRASDQCNDVYSEVKHYRRSSEISQALLTYEQARAQATADLATAHGELVDELFTSGAEAAVGEATLIRAAESATETFWTSVQNALDNPSS